MLGSKQGGLAPYGDMCGCGMGGNTGDGSIMGTGVDVPDPTLAAICAAAQAAPAAAEAYAAA